MVTQPATSALGKSDGEAYAARCNALATGYDRSTIEHALALAEVAHRALGLPYHAGRSRMPDFPPDRFEWVCSSAGNDVSIEVIDRRTGKRAPWPLSPA